MEEPGNYNAGAPQQTETVTPTEPAEQSQSKSLQCPTCSRVFPTAQGLQTHIIRAHRKFWSTLKPKRKTRHARLNLDTTCPICRVELKNKQTLGAHIRHVHGRSATEFPGFAKRGPIQFRARRGKLGMSATAALKLPKRMGRPRGNQSKTCPICSKKFSTRGIMGQHMRNMHAKTLTQYAAETAMISANGAMSTPAPRKARKGAKHRRGALECPVCHKVVTKQYLPGHMKLIHGKTLGQFKREQRGEVPATPVEQPTKRPAVVQVADARHVKFCPVCGTNIINVQTAVNFGG